MLMSRTASTSEDDWVAVVGMSCRFPNANSVNEYWNILLNGIITSGPPPEARKIETSTMNPLANFLKCSVEEFDATFFGISPTEASMMDPQSRLLHETSWEAFEDARINPLRLRGSKTGVFYGSWQTSYKDYLNEHYSNPQMDIVRKYLTNGTGSTGARLSYFYGFTGPNVCVDAACASSLVAVDLAVKSLRCKECPVALVAGANILLHLGEQENIWAANGRSKVFDATLDGYSRSDGVAVLILKPYVDALKDKNIIHGVIRGVGSSQEGLTKSFGAPTVNSEVSCMRQALGNAGLDPSDVDWVEAHATGTAVGDPVEAKAIAEAYLSNIQRKNPLYIASVKGNIGHSESCSGLAGFVKIMLSMKHDIIPRHVGMSHQHPKIDFQSIPGVIPLEHVVWPRTISRPRIAGVSSFGITGTDVHVLVQEPPLPAYQAKSSAHVYRYILPISAKTEEALDTLIELFNLKIMNENQSLADICFSAGTSRPHHGRRVAIVASTADDLRLKLEKKEFISATAKVGSTEPNICFVFSGNTGHVDLTNVQMLYAKFLPFKIEIDLCSEIFMKCYPNKFPPFSDILTNTNADLHKLEEKAGLDAVLQFGLLISCQCSLAKIWNSWGVRPAILMGHSLGELTTAVISQAMELEDAFRVIGALPIIFERQKSMPLATCLISTNLSDVEDLIDKFRKKYENIILDVAAEIANYQMAVVGYYSDIVDFSRFCQTRGVSCVISQYPFCAHTSLLEEGCARALPFFERPTYKRICTPFVASSTGQLVQTSELGAQYWYKVATGRVQLRQAISTVQENIGRDVIFLELGFNDALTRLVKMNMSGRDSQHQCIPSFSSSPYGIWNSLAQLYTLGASVNWQSLYASEPDLYQNVDLPGYPFQRKKYSFGASAYRENQYWNPEAVELKELFHPYLGNPISLSYGAISVFQNDWTSQLVGNTDWCISDHKIGETVIFPGAGFLEMFLAAYQAASSKKGVMNLDNIKFTCPLALQQSKLKRIQCGIEKEIGNLWVCSAPSLEANADWCYHSSANASWITDDQEYLAEHMQITVKKLGALNERAAVSAQDFYQKLAMSGLNFGPLFQSIRQIAILQDGRTVAKVVLPPKQQLLAGKLICHPILIDAMMQTYMYHTNQGTPSAHLQVPKAIQQFRLYRLGSETEQEKRAHWFVLCGKKNGESDSVTLFNSDGQIVASLNHVTMATTTVNSILSLAGEQTQMEDSVRVFRECWRQSSSFQLNTPATLPSQLQPSSALTPELSPGLDFNFAIAQKMDRLGLLYIQKAFLDLGISKEHNVDGVSQKILPGMLRAFRYFFNLFENSGHCSFSRISALEQEIKLVLESPELMSYVPTKLFHLCGQQLANIWLGKVRAEQLLFDENQLARQFYKESQFSQIIQPMSGLFLSWLPIIQSSCQVVKVLEVGGGTGLFTKEIVQSLQKSGAKVDYWYTDISYTLTEQAKTHFSNLMGNNQVRMQFRLLDISQDPLQQGFPPEYFDLVVACQVLHATPKLEQTLANIALLSKTGGYLLVGETEKPVMEADIIFGSLEGYWSFMDWRTEQGHCLISGEKWVKLMASVGFSQDSGALYCCGGTCCVVATRKTTLNSLNPPLDPGKCWMLFYPESGSEPAFSQLKTYMETFLGRPVKMICVQRSLLGQQLQTFVMEQLSETANRMEGILYCLITREHMEMRSVVEPLLEIARCVLTQTGGTPRLHLLTAGVWAQSLEDNEPRDEFQLNSSLAWGFMRALRAEAHHLVSKSVDLGTSGRTTEEDVRRIVFELWADAKETEVLYKQGVRYVRRLLDVDYEQAVELTIPPNPYNLLLPSTTELDDLKFVSASEEETPELAPNYVSVRVSHVSLNFLEVMVLRNPSDSFGKLRRIGFDFAGVVEGVGAQVQRWTTGQSVAGVNMETSSFQTSVRVREDQIFHVPPQMSLAEGASLPIVFITVWYCMSRVAKLKAGQTVLIHAVSGGVGLAAVQVAKLLRLRVVGTASSMKKREFAKSYGCDHVFSSRNLDFEADVQQVTGGKGVDAVLNSLTSRGFKEASLNCCRDGGYFLELGKHNIWTKQNVQTLRPLVNYEIVDLSADMELAAEMLEELVQLLKSGSIQPLPILQFPASRLIHALHYMERAKHIGKLVVAMPQKQNGQWNSPLFNDRSSYIITGGKGAIGWAVCRWMVELGAKHVVLVGRQQASSQLALEITNLERESGARICCVEMDVSNFAECQKLINVTLEQLQFPRLRGIHHAAGVLSDKIISHQDWNSFEAVFRPKVEGAWNLHQLTKHLPLEQFVLYSSSTATFGNAGQANHVSANTYLDALAQYRRSMDLPGLSINWGRWKAGLAENTEISWLPPFSVEEGIQTLELIMRKQPPNQVNFVAGRYNMAELTKKAPYFTGTFLEELLMVHSSSDEPKELPLREQFVAMEDSNGRRELVVKFLKELISDTLGLAEFSGDEETAFETMGMDSLMSVEVKNAIQRCLKNTETGDASDFYVVLEKHNTLNKLTEHVYSALSSLSSNVSG